MQVSGVEPDVVTYNAMISRTLWSAATSVAPSGHGDGGRCQVPGTCARARDPERAEGWLKQLLASNVKAVGAVRPVQAQEVSIYPCLIMGLAHTLRLHRSTLA